MKQFFKNLLLRNGWSDFKIISQECTLGDPFKNCLQKHGSGKWGLLALHGHEEILKRSSPKPLVRF